MLIYNATWQQRRNNVNVPEFVFGIGICLTQGVRDEGVRRASKVCLTTLVHVLRVVADILYVDTDDD